MPVQGALRRRGKLAQKRCKRGHEDRRATWGYPSTVSSDPATRERFTPSGYLIMERNSVGRKIMCVVPTTPTDCPQARPKERLPVEARNWTRRRKTTTEYVISQQFPALVIRAPPDKSASAQGRLHDSERVRQHADRVLADRHPR